MFNPSGSPAAPGLDNAGNSSKRKRRPAGTPDPDAEVVSLSPRTLMESDRYVCEICNQGFQRDQNLQMHRRRHKVPWKLLKRPPEEAAAAGATRKRVFVCPEAGCLHHDPRHALGDLVGIKKHYRRKHSGHKQWVCAKCSKGYAVQSDYKAHLKTCGTRGHSCDCGRVFSRVESFIEHQDACTAGRVNAEPACLSRAVPSPSRSSETNLSAAAPVWPAALRIPNAPAAAMFLRRLDIRAPTARRRELQLLQTISDARPTSSPSATSSSTGAAELELSIGPGPSAEAALAAGRLRDEAREQTRLAAADRAAAEEARAQARRQVEMAEMELSHARRLRHHAQAELGRACAVREHSVREVGSVLLQITCQACRSQFPAAPGVAANFSVDSSAASGAYKCSVTTEPDVSMRMKT
ncbi:putative protein indeterminate-domain 16 [Iris pallida]|uniref:C2H2-type domain-containing protein n=1 Tax=Iris pallida TaxID=29817 RepID=A0AAX6F954_IRIPA|nr:putative protein indeterminate-domain 16 [Iris pallida]